MESRGVVRWRAGGGLGVGGAGYVGSGYRERASDFLGACLPLPSAASSLGSLSRLKVWSIRKPLSSFDSI